MTLFCGRITNENTLESSRINFPCCLGMNMNKDNTPECPSNEIMARLKIWEKFSKDFNWAF